MTPISAAIDPEGPNRPGSSEMEERIASLDWSKTPIGPRENWPQALKTMVRILLANRFPMLLWWGPDYISIYNDAYIPILGLKHPWGLGKPVRECWSEIWDVLKPLIDTPFFGGPATWSDDIELYINRSGFMEETHFTIAYSPLPDEMAPRSIGGVLATVHEITAKIVGQRRGIVLRELASAVEARTADEACANIAAKLAAHAKDFPFALIYLCHDDSDATLAAASGAEASDIAPRSIRIDDHSALWPLHEARASGKMQVVQLTSRFGAIPKGPWPEPPSHAAVLPIRSHLSHKCAGFLVAGLSSRLSLDDSYTDFLNLVTSQIATAISTARAYEEERRRAEALAEIDRAKTAFFSNVSHEFRTPLTLMLGPLEEILKDNQLAPIDLERVDVAHRNSLRLLKLVNSMLDFSRLEAGRITASFAPVDLCTLTRDLASNFRSAVQAAGLELVVNCVPLPEPVYVDLEMWEKIVLNLLSNAFKFTFDGKITVTLTAIDQGVVLSVSDTGIGIPEAELPHIFERFHRVEGAKGRSYEGSGIGLALVQELVKMHGGSVTVESTAGKGSAFFVKIPLGYKHLPADQVKASASEARSSVRPEAFVEEALRWLPRGSGCSYELPNGIAMGIGDEGPSNAESASSVEPAPRILLADDNADMRDYVARLLGPRMRVTTVTNGRDALEIALKDPPDLILSDVMMPQLDGLGLLRELRANPATRTIPVILLSARAGEESRIHGAFAGADDYVVKPFSASELLARVTAHLNLARGRQDTLTAMRRLQEISTRLIGAGGLESLLQEIVNAAVALVNAQMGTLQLVEGDKLHIVAHAGRQQPFLEAELRESVCGESMKRRTRVLVEDVEASPIFARSPSLPVLRAAGVRAVQSTPLFSRNGKMLGILTTQWSAPHVPDEHDLSRLDLLVRQAADLIESSVHAELLRGHEERLTMTIDAAGMGTFDVNMRTGKALWSPRHFEILGYEAAPGRDATLEMWRACVHPEDLDKVDAALQSARKTGTRYVSEHRIIRADNGEVRWVAEFGRYLDDPAGEAQRFIGISFDMTGRVQAERTSHLLSAIVDSSDDAIISKNLSGVITSWNKSAERLFGYTAKEAIGQTVAALLIPADRQNEEPDILARLRRGERVDHFETRRRRKDGSLLDISLTISPVRDAHGHIVGASKVARDITESKRREAQLRKSEERFRQLAEVGPQFVWLVGPRGELEFVNQRWVEFSGLNLEATKDPSRLRSVLHPDDDVLGHWQRSVSSGSPFELEARLRRKDGEFRWFMMRSVPVRDEQGLIQRWFGTSTDIHDSKLLELELRRANRDLEQFAYSASHDLQEPLRSVRIFSELVYDRCRDQLDPKSRDFLAKVNDGASRMQMLVRDLLAYTQAAKADKPKEPADANAAFRDALGNLSATVEETRAVVDCEPLPSVLIEAVQLQQLFQNLVGNALKYHRKGVPPVVHAKARREAGDWLFSIADNGIGIEPEFREKIFGVFKRLHTSDEYSGTGIGLAICQRIVEHHGGRIWVESVPGDGSTFYFTLPA